VRCGASDGLSYPAADVVAGHDRSVHAEFVDQAENASRLRDRRVGDGWLLQILVRLAEASQVRDDHVGPIREQRLDLSVVRMITGPSVEKDDRRPCSRPLIRQPEPVYR
jgi:hypothetical protein